MSHRIEGRRAVLEALRGGLDVERIEMARGLKRDAVLEDIAREAAARGIPVDEVPRHALDAASERGRHQGVVAVLRTFQYATLAEVLRATADKPESLVVVLDHVTDPGNFGAIVRSAECAGADAVVVAERRSAPVTPVVHKAAAGALAYLPVVQVTNLARAIEELKQAGYWVLGASESAEMDLWRAPLEGRVALALGSEGRGLSRLVEASCDVLVSIPMRGSVASLNVAQAATVLLFEYVRRSASRG
ncbi:MAG: 23S rRNA (guanosine(2251)-2'-O)-methyltransferase RlmB [Anaerosomatales bacterium]|nr:23S rRNA (guanosine(2251)-2'-O)-methyltransferase RlmB [Anaerosomatales bacterium]